MSPERFEGQGGSDRRADIYALGIMLFEMLTLKPPFEARYEYELAKMHAEAPVPSVSEKRSDVPVGLDAIIQKACAKNRDERYATVEEMEAELRALVHGQSIPGSGGDSQPCGDVSTAPSFWGKTKAALGAVGGLMNSWVRLNGADC